LVLEHRHILLYSQGFNPKAIAFLHSSGLQLLHIIDCRRICGSYSSVFVKTAFNEGILSNFTLVNSSSLETMIGSPFVEPKQEQLHCQIYPIPMLLHCAHTIELRSYLDLHD
jgi:hypothetical protein